jgi:hypothetical protein
MATTFEESPQLFDFRLTEFVFTYFQKKKASPIAKKVRPNRNFFVCPARRATPANTGHVIPNVRQIAGTRVSLPISSL